MWPASSQVEAIRSGAFSAKELIGLYAARIEQLNPAINAVVTLDLERAFDDAAAVDARLARDGSVGALAGVPITVRTPSRWAGCAAPEHDLEREFLKRKIDIDGQSRSLVSDIPRWCGMLNAIGFPSCVVPVGRTHAGLPVGVQIVTDHLRDRDAIRVARGMEALIGGYVAPPDVAG
jgi:Asp-tRNA(Asn)/Glu-tRNA(Gln) amidotransferase A subunit family amidase